MPPDDPNHLDDIPRSSLRPRRPQPDRRWLWIASSVISAVVAVAFIAYLLINSFSANDPPLQPSEPGRPAPGATIPKASPATPPANEIPPADAAPPAAELVDDPTGQLLWGEPTSGPPISLAYVPAGTQCLLYFRPADIARHAEGDRLRAALGPWGQGAVAELESLLGGELSEVAALLVAVTVSDDNKLETTLRVEFAEPFDSAALTERTAKATSSQIEGVAIRTESGRAYFLANEPTPALIITPAALAEDLVESAGEAPPLVRDIEALVAHSDAEHAATLIVAPKFLQASGNDLLTAEAAPLHDVIQRLLGNEATAVMLSADLRDDLFLELRATPTLNVPAIRLAAKMRERIAAAPQEVEDALAAATWHPYGRKVIARLPGMLRILARYARSGVDDRQAVVNAYLPARAGHNLLTAGELLLTLPHGGDAAIASAAAGAKTPTSTAEKLAAKTSLSFTKESLEQAVALLAEDTGLEITIAGSDLQLDGITKNQSLGLDLRDRPASEILLEILLRANPDRQATGPADPRQKLVYVIEPTTTGAAERIIVTTRTAAEKRGDRLPAAFLPQTR
ncbi:hypothetical protein [Lacipirellula sp.]|uniref:hypothetical protein n=1 Tax=Lacipirellula sp. TaxID=2691419 RepID=UPI003D0A814C